jgi:hypothetical protein
MITGAHSIIYSTDSKADRDFFKKILKFPNVDIGQGWLIFGLPPSEIAVHPAAENGLQEFYLMCDDINLFVKEMSKHKIICSAIENQSWGLLTYLTLPGGGKLGVYEPKHLRPVNHKKSSKPKVESKTKKKSTEKK